MTLATGQLRLHGFGKAEVHKLCVGLFCFCFCCFLFVLFLVVGVDQTRYTAFFCVVKEGHDFQTPQNQSQVFSVSD